MYLWPLIIIIITIIAIIFPISLCFISSGYLKSFFCFLNKLSVCDITKFKSCIFITVQHLQCQTISISKVSSTLEKLLYYWTIINKCKKFGFSYGRLNFSLYKKG